MEGGTVYARLQWNTDQQVAHFLHFMQIETVNSLLLTELKDHQQKCSRKKIKSRFV